jgi:hypothetical protein
MGQKETALTGKSRFMIYCPRPVASIWWNFARPTANRSRSQLPSGKTAVLRHFQARHALRLGGAGRSMRNI